MDDGTTPAGAPGAPGLDSPSQPPVTSGRPRPWYTRKRFLLPVGAVALFGAIGALGGQDETSPATEPVAATEQEAQVADQEPSEEELAAEQAAAEEAAKAEAEQKAAEEAARAEAERVAAEQRAAEEAAKGTLSQQNAYASALSYLDFKGFSRAGLIDQLSSEYGEGYPVADAEFAVARLEAEGRVDWNAEAAEAAASYLEFKPFSRQGLIDQLTSEYGEEFTLEQAEYGVSQVGL